MIKSGVWPTMLTPFTEEGGIDYNGLEKLVEWYIGKGAAGLFAVCQSSEMFYLQLEEKISIIKFILKIVNGRIPVIASGHTSADYASQERELLEISGTGIEALVLITNLLAGENKDEDAFKRNTEKLLGVLPEIDLGLYECPYPYKYLLPNDLLRWCAETGRFMFLKDTCCDSDIIRLRIKNTEDTGLKIFNANSATLLQSLKDGAYGFSGVMANFYPELYIWLCRNFNEDGDKINCVQDLLSMSSVIEYQLYPANAKYFLSKSGLPLSVYTRTNKGNALGKSAKMELDAFKRVMDRNISELGL